MHDPHCPRRGEEHPGAGSGRAEGRPRWKSWIKGVFDLQRREHSFLVTGSARLDVYRSGGDSLMGRYHYWRLHPFSLDELPRGMSGAEAMRRLMLVGGFPEPLFDFDEREARRWRRERFDRVLREDVRDLEAIRNITLLGMFLSSLRSRAGRPVVLSNLASDLEVSPRTAKSWLEVLERRFENLVAAGLLKRRGTMSIPPS